LRAYALLYSRYGTRERFRQSALDWIVSTSMRKKIFSVLLRSGWIVKQKEGYTCADPSQAITGLLDFRVPEAMKQAERAYAFTQLSAVEIWSDFSYVQRGREKSPYYIKILRKDLKYWKAFFGRREIPCYVGAGSTIGEFVVLIPCKTLASKDKGGFKVEPLKEAMRYAKSNDIYEYAADYMENKYGEAA